MDQLENVIQYLDSADQLNHIGIKAALRPLLSDESVVYYPDVADLLNSITQESNQEGVLRQLQAIQQKYLPERV